MNTRELDKAVYRLLSENLDNKEQSIFRNKYVMYPLGSSTIIIIAASGIGLSMRYKK